MATFDETLTDGIGTASTLERLFRSTFPALSDTVTSVGDPTAYRAIPAPAAETVGIASVLTDTRAVLVRERLMLAEALIGNQKSTVVAADVLRLSEIINRAEIALLSDGVGVSLSQSTLSAIAIVERLGLREALGANAIYRMTLTQAIRLGDGLYRFFGADIDETIGIDEALVTRQLAAADVVDSLGIEVALTPQFILHVVAADRIGIDDTDVVRMLFNPTLRDGVEINAGFLRPDGTLTTWVMNARTGAVTEYENYEFNSFATLGNRYIGTSSSGLYELLGDTDDGSNIIARIKGGYMQFGGTHLSRLGAAYIAATGEGRMILKIITKEGDEYVYQADTRNGRNTKVHMGKGQRSRYFAFELTTVGQDFDLDTLEFVPIVVQRRV